MPTDPPIRTAGCIFGFVLAIALSGCGSSDAPSTAGDQHNSGRAAKYAIVIREGMKQPESDIQHRMANVGLLEPCDRDTAKRVIREVYDSFVRDIEATRPQARFKRINVRLYESADAARNYQGLPILRVDSGHNAGPLLPSFEDAELEWNWRDSNKPTTKQRELHLEFNKLCREAHRKIDVSYEDSDGILRLPREALPEYNRRKNVAEAKVAVELCQRYGVTQEELARAVIFCAFYDTGGGVSTESVEKEVESQVQEWACNTKT